MNYALVSNKTMIQIKPWSNHINHPYQIYDWNNSLNSFNSLVHLPSGLLRWFTHTYPHKPLNEINSGLLQPPDWQPLVTCGLMSDLVICKLSIEYGYMVIHDTECSYWDRMSLNNGVPLHWDNPASYIFETNSGCISLLLPRLQKLSSQCYSHGPGSLANLGSNIEMLLK